MLLILSTLLLIATILLILLIGQKIMLSIIIAAIVVAVWRSHSTKANARKHTAHLRTKRTKTAHASFSKVEDRFNQITDEWVAKDSRIVPGDNYAFFTRYDSAKSSIAAAKSALANEDTSTYAGITQVESCVAHAKEEISRLENEWSHVTLLNPSTL